MTTIQYQKKTGRFSEDELLLLQTLPAGELADVLMCSDPLVTLRAVAEVMLNEDEEKLKLLLADPILTLRWQRYGEDPEVDDRDKEYAKQLEEKLAAMIPK